MSKTIKVFLSPNPLAMKADKADGGIRRVVEAQAKYLPEFGVEVVDNPNKADIINNHGSALTDVKGIPLVSSSHGLYWSRYAWDEVYREVNKQVILSMKMSVAHTAPSEWVAVAMRRGMMIYPEVVYHGVEPTEWDVSTDPQKYILYNKARQDAVSNAEDMMTLARMLPQFNFLTTIGTPTPNVKVTGAVPYGDMKNIVKHAGLYLATARETFGIGTLEALACFTYDTKITASGIKKGMSRRYTGKLLTIKTRLASIRVTPEHPFWTSDGWVLAKSLTKKHRLCYNYSYESTQEIHRGAIGDIVKSISKKPIEFSGEEEQHHKRGATRHNARQGYKEAVFGLRSHENHKFLASRVGVYGWYCGRGGDCDNKKEWEETKGYDSHSKHKSRINELATGEIREADGGIPVHYTAEGKQVAVLHAIYNGHGVSPVVQVTPAVHDNKTEATETYHRMDGVALGSEQDGNSYPSPLGNNSPHQGIEYQAIEEITEEYVSGLSVFNLSTKTGTYLADGYLVHNCGVPVVGWDWGGQSEIIKHGETGYLAAPGDYTALSDYISLAMQERHRLSVNARLDVESRWTWQPRIMQYADIYKRTLAEWNSLQAKVSIILTCHNLERYMDSALKSVKQQSMEDWECIIVDDQSTDNTAEIANRYVQQDSRFKYFKTPTNLKLTGACNYGFQRSTGRYVIFFDPDDIADEHAARIMSDALDADKTIHIVYGHLDIMNDAGEERRRNDWPFEQFDWRGQMAHLNQLPHFAMMRREVFERMGGYRTRHWRAEDANFWCRATSFGFNAKKVTERSLSIYRMRNDSKSKGEPGDGDWTQWYPWRIAGNPREAQSKWPLVKSKVLPDPTLVPFGAQGEPPDKMISWYAHDHSYPKVSVVIPVGPGHEIYVIDAVESVMAQTYPDWEIIVVNATGVTWPAGFLSPVAGAPYVKVIDAGKKLNAAAARNLGFTHARGEAFFPLDADDYILPNCLERMVAYLELNNGIIFSGWLKNTMDDKQMEYYQPVEFECGKIIEKMWHSGSSILIPRWLYDRIGGWDENILGWEDWDFLIAAQHHGGCSYQIPEPLFVYRFHAGTQRNSSWNNKKNIIDYVNEKWYAYRTGEKTMGCGCQSKKGADKAPTSTMSSSGNFAVETLPSMTEETMLLEYQGQYEGPVTIRGPQTGLRYRFGNNPPNNRKYVRLEDVDDLLARDFMGKREFVTVGEKKPSRTPEFAELPITEPQVPEFPVPA